MRTPFVIALTLGLILLPGCSTSPNTAAGERALDDECQYAINDFKRVKGLEGFFAESAAYAVFPGVGKGGLIVGAAYGDGQLYQGGEAVGYCSLSQATVGLQIGGQKYRELIFFRSPASVRMFKQGRFELSAQAAKLADQFLQNQSHTLKRPCKSLHEHTAKHDAKLSEIHVVLAGVPVPHQRAQDHVYQ